MKKLRLLIFPLAVILTILAFVLGGFVGNFIGYMTIGCVVLVGFFYLVRFII